MEEFGGARFEGAVNTIRKKRSQISRRPRPDSQPFLSSSPPLDVSKVSSDENAGRDNNSRRKEFNLNHCDSRAFSSNNRIEVEYPHKKIKKEDGESISYYQNGQHECAKNRRSQGVLAPANWKSTNKTNGSLESQSRVIGDGVGNDNKLKKVKLKVGGVTRTIQAKFNSHGGASGSGSSAKTVRTSDAPRPRQKLILQDNSDDDDSSPPSHNKSSMQGVPWKEFSKRGNLSLGKEDSFMGKMPQKNASGKQGENLEPVRKSKRVPKRRVLDGEFDEDNEDDEIRYLEKLKTSKLSVRYNDIDEESSKKLRRISSVSKNENYDENFKDSKSKSRSDRVSKDTDYEEDEELVSDCEPGDKKKKKMRKDSVDSPTENKREITLTTRQRALLSGKDASSASEANLIEFPNGLPPAPPRKQKEKLTEVEQQLKKAEAAQRRRVQVEKAARESEAEAIRKILGQDSSRKKREDKIKKRQEELAQEKAANELMNGSTTIRWVMGPGGTVVSFPKEMGLPRIFDPKPCSYPPPREKCARPYCTNPYKYRDSKSKLPLCSLQCYKAINEKMQAETAH